MNKTGKEQGARSRWGTDRLTFTTSHMCFDRETRGTDGTEEDRPLRNCGGVREGFPKGVIIKAQREGEQQLDQGRWRGCRGKGP